MDNREYVSTVNEGCSFEPDQNSCENSSRIDMKSVLDTVKDAAAKAGLAALGAIFIAVGEAFLKKTK